MKRSSVVVASLALGALGALGCSPTKVATGPVEPPVKPAPAETVHIPSEELKATAPAAPLQRHQGRKNEAYNVVRRGEARFADRAGITPGVHMRRFPSSPVFHTEEYSEVNENIFHAAVNEPLSTFSIDVDAASYANVRRFLMGNQLPPIDAVRIEEFINYFSYSYPQPADGHPFSITTEVAQCPWSPGRRLVLIGLKGREIDLKKAPATHLVFLIDTSGSMQDDRKLPLLKSSFRLLVNELRSKDKVSIVTYAGSAGLVLPPTDGNQKERILAAIDNLHAGGSTAGGQGIELAYKVARENLVRGGNNRIVLATDGDFNVGVSSDAELVRLIEEKRKNGIFLTVLGFGMGNYKDSKMEKLADKGNGNYAYIDSILEAKKVLVSQMGGTLHTIAKDVKLQVEFNPARVKGYRLIGYENRLLRNEDFNDDTKDAGELGAGHTVTALYEVIPARSVEKVPGVDELKYQRTLMTEEAVESSEILTVKFRYKKPASDNSVLLSSVLDDREIAVEDASDNLKFAAAVAGFGMVLRNSEHKGNFTCDRAYTLAKGALGDDKEGYRAEFLRLVRTAQAILSSQQARQ